jgi:hypothetical protein
MLDDDRVERIVARAKETAGVDEREREAFPFSGLGVGVPGRTRYRSDDRPP